MSHLRLIGLALFVTAIFLGLAAAVTQTTHISVFTDGRASRLLGSQPIQHTTVQGTGAQSNSTSGTGAWPQAGWTGTTGNSEPGDAAAGNGPAADSYPAAWFPRREDWPGAANEGGAPAASANAFGTASFESIPIAWPLLATAGLGLLLWFIPTPGGVVRGAASFAVGGGGIKSSSSKSRGRRRRR